MAWVISNLLTKAKNTIKSILPTQNAPVKAVAPVKIPTKTVAPVKAPVKTPTPVKAPVKSVTPTKTTTTPTAKPQTTVKNPVVTPVQQTPQQKADAYIAKHGTAAQKAQLATLKAQQASSTPQPATTPSSTTPPPANDQSTTTPDARTTTDQQADADTSTAQTTEETTKTLKPTKDVFGKEAQAQQATDPWFLENRNSVYADEINNDPRLNETNAAQLVEEKLKEKGIANFQTNPADVANTTKQITDMIKAKRQNDAEVTRFSSMTWDGILQTATSDQLEKLKIANPAKYAEYLKAKQDADAAAASNATISDAVVTPKKPEPPDYDTMLKEAGLDRDTVDLNAEYTRIFNNPTILNAQNALGDLDKQLTDLQSQKNNLKDDLTKRFAGTGITTWDLGDLYNISSEGIDRQIQTVSAQRENMNSKLETAMAAGKAEYQAIQDNAKAVEDKKWKMFEQKYGMAKDKYEKERKAWEDEVDFNQQETSKATQRKYDEKKMMTKEQRDDEDAKTKRDYQVEDRDLKYDVQKEMKNFDRETKMKTLTYSGEQRLQYAKAMVLFNKKYNNKVTSEKAPDGKTYFFDSNNPLKPIGVLDGDGMHYPEGEDPSSTSSVPDLPAAKPSGNYVSIKAPSGRSFKADATVAPTFENALQQMKAAGLPDVIVAEWLRDTARQAKLYADFKSGKGGQAAAPGTSMHEKWMAFDLYSGKDPKTGKLLPPTPAQVKILNQNWWIQWAWQWDLWHFQYVWSKAAPAKAAATTTPSTSSLKWRTKWTNPSAGVSTEAPKKIAQEISDSLTKSGKKTSFTTLKKIYGDAITKPENALKVVDSFVANHLKPDANTQDIVQAANYMVANLTPGKDAFAPVNSNSIDMISMAPIFQKKVGGDKTAGAILNYKLQQFAWQKTPMSETTQNQMYASIILDLKKKWIKFDPRKALKIANEWFDKNTAFVFGDRIDDIEDAVKSLEKSSQS